MTTIMRSPRACALVGPEHRQVQALPALAPDRVEAPRTCAGKREIEEDEAIQDRAIPAVEDREEVARLVADEIGERHLARLDEGGRPREQAEQHQDRPDE